MCLQSPTKAEKRPVIINDKESSESPKTVTEESEDDIEDYRKRFVGEVDLPEGVSSVFFTTSGPRTTRVTCFVLVQMKHFSLTMTQSRPGAALDRVETSFCFVPYPIP